MRFFTWLIKVFLYLLYTLVVLAVLLWYQFPAAAVKTRLQSELSRFTPGLHWNIGSIGLALPADFRLTDIKISIPANRKEPLFIIQSLSLRPDLRLYLQDRKLSAGYQLRGLSGSVRGRLNLADNHNRLFYNGKVTGIKVNDLNKNILGIDRAVSGTLSGSFTGKGMLRGSKVENLQADFKLLKGSLGFQEPVLGMKQLVFSKVSGRAVYSSGTINLSDGRIDSRLLDALFSGAVKPGISVASSTLNLKGVLIPRPEFLSGLGNATTVNLLKAQLKDGKLPFTINGTLKEPGIVFPGLPVDFNQQLQGGHR